MRHRIPGPSRRPKALLEALGFEARFDAELREGFRPSGAARDPTVR